MTNRTYIRPYSAGMTIKKPRLRRLEIAFDGPPPTPEGINNGIRPHGGYRGTAKHPPCNYSFNREDAYHNEVNEGFQLLLTSENNEHHGSPYWLTDVHRESTHSGESPLFTNKLLATGKFEQEHGVINFERALLHTAKPRRSSAPRRRTENGKREFYRPNSTHQYLTATELKDLNENEAEMIGKYGRPTRTTLLRARQRSNSAPVNAYDIRRENSRRVEDVKTNSIFCTSKELFDREQTRISYRFYNIYASDGETMHSFLTGARYNRAHLVDSKGLSMYGVYMPRENPTDCFITGNRRQRDISDDIPSAPPDSPRSDFNETPSPRTASRPSSSRFTSRPTSSQPSSRPTTRQTSSRPQSYKKSTPRTPLSRPRSAKEIYSPSGITRILPPRSGDSSKRDPLPDELTLTMPDHINKAGKAGVYVTLKGQKMIETLESNLPRVTGVSLPKLRKSRDAVDEMLVVNQPPPTPVDVSVGSMDRTRLEAYNAEDHRLIQHTEDKLTEVENENEVDNENYEREPGKVTKIATADVERPEIDAGGVVSPAEATLKAENATKDTPISKVYVSENEISERKSLEIGPIKRVNFKDSNESANVVYKSNTSPALKNSEIVETPAEVSKVHDDKECTEIAQTSLKPDIPADINNDDIDDNVIFFVTEENERNQDNECIQAKEDRTELEQNENVVSTEVTHEDEQKDDIIADDVEGNGVENTSVHDNEISDVIKVNISEAEKKTDSKTTDEDTRSPITSDDFPFNTEAENSTGAV